jgi:hypothetical protein
MTFVSAINLSNTSKSKQSLARRIGLVNKVKKTSIVVGSNLINNGLYISIDSYTTSTGELNLSISGTISKDTTLTSSIITSGAKIDLSTPIFQSGNIATWTGTLHFVPDKVNTFYLIATKSGTSVKYAVTVTCLHTPGFTLSISPSRITITDMNTKVSTVMHDETIIYNSSVKPLITNKTANNLKVKYGNYSNLLIKADLTLITSAYLKAMVNAGETVTVIDNNKNYIYHITYNVQSKTLNTYKSNNSGSINWLYKETENTNPSKILYYDYTIDENKYVIGA